MYTFFNNNNVTYNLQFGFGLQYYTVLGDENIGCWVFADLQRASDTVDHQTLLAKLDHYGICGVSNDWFKSYLSNRNQ